ncbi:MAG TPA: MarR family transcriptional regulator [Trebonia sp.]|nr:MarR family transcriptional regulator [Trebonia sp.]
MDEERDARGPGSVEPQPEPGKHWALRLDGEGVPADAPLSLLIVIATRLMGTYYADTVRRAGVRLSPAGLGVLRVLLEQDGLKSSEVATRGATSPGTLTAVVNTLMKEGYVSRRPDDEDRRVIRLHITDEGRAAAEAYALVAGPLWRDAFKFVSERDEPVIRDFFHQMISTFSKLTREERGT